MDPHAAPPPFGHLHQIARRVENLDRARVFLRDVLGLMELYHFPGLAFFALGSTRLMLRETGQKDPADILYFRTDDIARRVDAIRAGAKVIAEPQCIHTHPDGTEEWMAFFEDDEGRTLAFASLRPAARPAL